MKRNVLVVTCLFVLTLSACTMRERAQIKGKDASPDALPTIVGSYSVNGFDPLGTEYGGNLTVAPAEGADQYKLQWIITGSIQEGEGRIEGNKLIVQWQPFRGQGPGRHRRDDLHHHHRRRALWSAPGGGTGEAGTRERFSERV